MASGSLVKHVVLTGKPGVGKTTLILKICEQLKAEGIELRGFYTQEQRERGQRTGFSVVTLDGQTGPLAHIEETSDIYPRSKTPRVGKYAVKVPAFESLALPSLNIKDLKNSDEAKKCILVIDEIGKMELFSQSFETCVKNLLKENIAILATIPVPHAKPLRLVEQIRSAKQTQLYTVTRDNRNKLQTEITEAILAQLSGKQGTS